MDQDWHVRLHEYGTASNYGSGPKTGPAFRAEPFSFLNIVFLKHKKLPNDQTGVQYLNPDLPKLILVMHGENNNTN
jgi:hypothetical protein